MLCWAKMRMNFAGIYTPTDSSQCNLFIWPWSIATSQYKQTNLEDQSSFKDQDLPLDLRKGIILTKDNLAKHNWTGSKQCCFCHIDQTIRHLFFDCHFSRAVWAIIYVSTGLLPPRSVTNMFGSWLRRISVDIKPFVPLGATTFCWSMWLCRNDMVFEKRKLLLLLYRLFIRLSTSFVHGLFFKKLLQDLVIAACQRLASFLPRHMGGSLV
jgi:hypothetical protein